MLTCQEVASWKDKKSFILKNYFFAPASMAGAFSCQKRGQDHGRQRDKRKRTGRSEREMATPLFLLRCTEVGISMRDLDLLTISVVLDMWTEKANDGVKYRRIADQTDFDKF